MTKFVDTILAKYAKGLVSAKGTEPSIFKAVLNNRQVEEIIIKFNTRDQIQVQGIDTEGSIIGTYSFATEVITGGRKQEGAPFDLTDTGAFIASWKVIIGTGEIRILTNPKKFDEIKGITIDLFEKLDNFKIVGLTDENQSKFNEFAKRLFISDYKQRFIR